jgi:hypothetical protein
MPGRKPGDIQMLAGYWTFYASNEQSSRLLFIRRAIAPSANHYTYYYEGHLDSIPVELELDTIAGGVVMLVGSTGLYRLTQKTTTIYIGTVMNANQQVIAGTFNSSTIAVVKSVCLGSSTPPLEYWTATFQGPEIPPEPTGSAQGQ